MKHTLNAIAIAIAAAVIIPGFSGCNKGEEKRIQVSAQLESISYMLEKHTSLSTEIFGMGNSDLVKQNYRIDSIHMGILNKLYYIEQLSVKLKPQIKEFESSLTTYTMQLNKSINTLLKNRDKLALLIIENNKLRKIIETKIPHDRPEIKKALNIISSEVLVVPSTGKEVELKNVCKLILDTYEASKNESTYIKINNLMRILSKYYNGLIKQSKLAAASNSILKSDLNNALGYTRLRFRVLCSKTADI